MVEAATGTGASSVPMSRLQNWMQHPGVVLALLLLLAAILLRGNADKPFYNFDDEEHFRIATERSPGQIFFNFDTKKTYMPISFMSLRLDRILFGPPLTEADPTRAVSESTETDAGDGIHAADQPAEYYFNGRNWAPPVRIESALYHALAGFMLWAFLRQLKVGPGVALFVASAWTAHPMACESVCWISERKNVLAGLFGFAALWAQTRRTIPLRWIVVSFFYLLSTLSKPTGVGVFPIIVALEFLDPSSPTYIWTTPRKWARLATGLIGPLLAGPLLITLAIVKINMSIHQVYFVAPPGGTVFTALLTDLDIFSRYMFNIILPVNLSFFYGIEPIHSLGDARVWLFGGGMVAYCALLIWVTKQELRALTVLGLLWFFGALGPNSNIAAIPYWMQDRYAYISTAGLLLAVALGVQGQFALFQRQSFAIVAGAPYIALIAVLAFIRAPLFAEASFLVDDAAARQPSSGMAHYISGLNHANRAFYNTDPQYIRSGGQLEDARRALYENDIAMQCPDITNFCNVYRLRVKCAQILLKFGAYADARAYLKGWLPPPNYQMSDPTKVYKASEQTSMYRPQTLAYAWIIMAEARWRLALALDRKTVPVAARIAETNAAIAEVDRSISISIWDYQGYVLKARMLLFLSVLDEENKDLATSNKHVDEASRLLRQVPATSELGGEAGELLRKIVPLK